MSFAHNILLFSIEFVRGTIQISKNNFSFLKMFRGNWKGLKPAAIDYAPRNFLSLPSNIPNDQLQELSSLNDTPLSTAVETYLFIISRVEVEKHPFIYDFFRTVSALYAEYRNTKSQLDNLQQQWDNLQQPQEIQQIEHQEQLEPSFDDFRDYLLYKSKLAVVQEELRKIVDYNNDQVNKYVFAMHKACESQDQWNAWACPIIGSPPNSWTKISPTKLKEYIQNQCKSNFAIRSNNMEEVINNIIKFRNFK